jgi:hypothetical protein
MQQEAAMTEMLYHWQREGRGRKHTRDFPLQSAAAVAFCLEIQANEGFGKPLEGQDLAEMAAAMHVDTLPYAGERQQWPEMAQEAPAHHKSSSSYFQTCHAAADAPSMDSVAVEILHSS